MKGGQYAVEGSVYRGVARGVCPAGQPRAGQRSGGFQPPKNGMLPLRLLPIYLGRQLAGIRGPICCRRLAIIAGKMVPPEGDNLAAPFWM